MGSLAELVCQPGDVVSSTAEIGARRGDSEWGASENNRRARFYRRHASVESGLKRDARVAEGRRYHRSLLRCPGRGLEMMRFHELFHRAVNTLTRRRQDERLRPEIAEHIALLTEDNIRSGMPPDEARRQAMLRFGAVEGIKEN